MNSNNDLLAKVQYELDAIRVEMWLAVRREREEARESLKRNMKARDKYTRPYRQTRVIVNGVQPLKRSHARRRYVQDLTERQTQLAERILNEIAQNSTIRNG